MPSIRTTYWLAILVLAGVGYLFFFERTFESTTEHARRARQVLAVSGDQVERIKMHRDAWTSATIERTGPDGFRLTEPAEHAVDGSAVAKLLSALEFLEFKDALPGEAASARRLQEYGFDPGRLEVDLGIADGREPRLTFGATPPLGGGVYLRVSANDTVFVVDSAIFDLFDKELDKILEAGDQAPTHEGG